MKIAFVLPWYGKYARGGAEFEAKGMAENLKKSGVSVEVLTTCVKGPEYSWNEDFYEEGVYVENNVVVRRFSADRHDDKLFKMIAEAVEYGERVSEIEEELFLRNSVGSRKLYRYIKEHRDEYVFIFTPYLFGTTYWGSYFAEDRAVLIPCLHDEGYAHLGLFKGMFQRFEGFIFYSHAEKELAKRLYGISDDRVFFIGGGVDTEFKSDGERFREKYGIREPFILYVGRKAEGKNVYLLLRYFLEYKRRNPSDLRLVFIGPGGVRFDRWGDVLDLGFVSLQDKYDAYGAAEFLCQPSVNESFSLVVMESWLVGRPVLVNGGCEVTRGHCEESGGGLWFRGYGEFEEVVNYMLGHRGEMEEMGENGRRYVLENYTWETVVENYRKMLRRFESREWK